MRTVDIVKTATSSGLTESNAEARRLLEQGGLRLDERVLTAADRFLPWDEVSGRFLRRGKRREVYCAPMEEGT